ncbi:DUF5667 domain-containing protein [Streptomyces zagrosensis]|uniref:DUF5667 domain-containing protein n=1 Tax=Streptomyces zagrosensis TaxID=1042984 RepID=A0A7W9QCW8_9ACTN|nr:DUF5667 domain-containing protein [Streptomyces zagrosensis]MBB5937958.1 hypothetical protein [Streptomyces zagrosensis]
MIANVSAHRRANAFAQALEKHRLQGTAASQSEHPAENTECDRMLALANELGELPAPELDPTAKTVQRAQLIAAMETAFAEGAIQVPEQRSGPSTKKPAKNTKFAKAIKTGKGSHRASPLGRFRPRSRWSKGLAAGGLTVGVAAGAFGGVATASSDALPGDSLYGLKRGIEDFKRGMADDDADRGGIYLDQASTRMQEARRLMERARAGEMDHESVGEVRKALSGMRHAAAEGHRLLHRVHERDGSLEPIRELSSFATDHREGWSALRARLPLPLSDMGDEVSSVFDAIDQEVEPLRSLLTPPAPDEAKETQPAPTAPNASVPAQPDRPAPRHAKPRPTDRTEQQQRDGSPHPSMAPTTKSPDLLDGPDLLEPPAGESGPDLSLPSDESGSQTPAPDVTVPPLLDLLPGLGLDAHDTTHSPQLDGG